MPRQPVARTWDRRPARALGAPSLAAFPFLGTGVAYLIGISFRPPGGYPSISPVTGVFPPEGAGMRRAAATARPGRSLNPIHLSAGRRRMRVQPGRIGRIRTEMTGSPCPHCDSTKYLVVLNRGLPVGPGTLVSRCAGCRTQRDLDQEGMKAAVLFRYGLRLPGRTIPDIPARVASPPKALSAVPIP